MLGLLLVWAALLIILVVFGIGRPRDGGALTLAYFLGLSLIHVPGVLAFIGFVSVTPVGIFAHQELTEIGFEITIIGMAAFILGAILARATDLGGTSIALPPDGQVQVLQRIGRRALTFGVLAYFVLLPLSSLIPSTTPLISALAT